MTTRPDKISNQYMIRQNVEALGTWIEGFLRDRRGRDLSPFTIEYYRAQLAAFETFARARNVIQVHEITADVIRSYFIHLEETNHNAGVPITQISVLLGHSSVKTSQEYLNLNLDLESTASDFVPLAG